VRADERRADDDVASAAQDDGRAADGTAPRAPGALLTAVAVVLCTLAVALAYGNSLRNEFALDDAHTIESNAWIRSLAHVPRYFVDASTFSTLRTNVDYRPLLQTTYAVNYAISGYDVRSWRLVNLALHLVVTLAVFFLGRRLAGSRAPRPLPGLPPDAGDLAALAAALLFALHPIGSGCVNYISARSSSLTAALVLPALVLHLRALAAPPARLARCTAALLFVLALLTKIEALSLLPVLVLADVLLDPAKQDVPLWRRLFDGALWRRLWPFCAIAIACALLWWSRTGLDQSATRAGVLMTPRVYFLTQLRAWWYYVGLVVAPLDLVADYPSYPVSRSLLEPRVLLALAGWIAVVLLALAAARRLPAITFLVLSFFLYLAPHSSVVPLAEPVNEHRPYLALTGVFLLAALLLVALVRRLTVRPVVATALLVTLLAVPLAALTRARNLDWRDAETLWGDTVRKAPDSPRGQMNYGLALMRRGRYGDAETRFREAVRLAPSYHLAYTNLGIVLAAQGNDDAARRAYDDAVRISPSSDSPFFWRGRFRASRGDRAGAIDDFMVSARNSSAPFREWAALTELLSAAGREQEAAQYAQRAGAVDAAGFARERAEFRATVLDAARPAPAVPVLAASAVTVMNEGVALMGAGQLGDAEARFRHALELAPAYDLAMTNLGIVLAAQGRVAEARAAHDRAVVLGAGSGSAFYWRGRFLVEQGDLAGAANDFSVAVERSPASVRELAALAETLARARRADESASVIARGEAADRAAFMRERASFAATVKSPLAEPDPQANDPQARPASGPG